MNTGFRRQVIGWLVVVAALAPVGLRAYLVGPPEGLAKMTTNADLVCKARVVSSLTITNPAFQPLPGFETQATTLEIISLLEGDYAGKSLTFQHYAANPGGAIYPYAPQHYELVAGQCYLVFAVKAGPEGEFRQIRLSHTGKEDEGVTRTLDARSLSDLVEHYADSIHSIEERSHPIALVREAHWFEIQLLLQSPNPTSQLYAIHQLDAMSKGGNNDWSHTDDFKRETVLRALMPLVALTNDEVSVAALHCFAAGPERSAQLAPFAETLAQAANAGSALPRRLAAMAAFSGTSFPVVSNALPAWLRDPSEEVRLQAVLLLPSFPGEFSERALRERASDPSPRVRAGVADAIGNGKIKALLPTLITLLSDPVGLTNPVPPLTTKELQSGGRVWGDNNGDVHTAAGYALLKFDVGQVGDTLKANLNDAGFRPNYLCKLAENDPGPWLTNLVEILEARRVRLEKEADTSGAEPKAAYLQALLALAGTPFKCWNLIYQYLHDLPAPAFAEGKMDRCLNALEEAGDTGSREPTMLYELYRMKGLNQRAAQFRRDNAERFAPYNLSQFFDRADAQYTNQAGVSGR